MRKEGGEKGGKGGRREGGKGGTRGGNSLEQGYMVVRNEG